MNNFTFKSIVKRFSPRRRSESVSAQFGRDPRADWQLVFIVFLVLNVLSFLGNAYLYAEINKGELFQLPKRDAQTLHAISRTELHGAIDFFDTKGERFEALLKEPLVVADPGPAVVKSKK